MADNRYRSGGSYGRSDSIFNDDERGESRGQNRHGSGQGFFQRAGEEVLSWFGSDEDDRRQRGQLYGHGQAAGRHQRSDYGPYQGGRDGGDYHGQNMSSDQQTRHQDHAGSYGLSYGGSGSSGMSSDGSYSRAGQGGRSYAQGAEGQGRDSYSRMGGSSASYGNSSGGYEQQGQSGSSAPFDDHYRSWRDRHISQLDQEYEEYCRHRQSQFENDFGGWRQSRSQNAADQSGAHSKLSGSSADGTQSGNMAASSETTSGMASGGATAEGGSTLSADASTGTSNRTSGRSRAKGEE